jgi:hypothetical protein
MTVARQKQFCMSKSYGVLEKADSFVYRDFEPANEATWEIVRLFAVRLDLPLKGRMQSKKYIRCLSDFLVAARTTESGLIAWPGGSSEYHGLPYGHSVAKFTRESLLKHGVISLYQRASKRDGLSRVFKVNLGILPSQGNYKQHGEGPLVIVKSKKIMKHGKFVGGVIMGRRNFEPEITDLENQVSKFNNFMTKNPLVSPDDVQYIRCYRVFNNGSLKSGGRIYGSWQTLPEIKRLGLTIEGEQVCEIDMKASFLSIASGLTGSKASLPQDPYQKIKFVTDAHGTEDEKLHRNAAKALVNSFLSKEGDLTQFPKSGKKDEGTGKAIPFKDIYNLNNKCGHYMDQIHSSFPFLRKAKVEGYDLMFKESQIIIGAMDTLKSDEVVSWPVHDSLLVKVSDRGKAIDAMRESMASHVNGFITMDVSYLDGNGAVVSEIVSSGKNIDDHEYVVQSIVNEEWDDDDYEVLDIA